ncbi:MULTISPECIES: sugar ABC transporter permease [unclassified Mesorhizobium]|uniref:carbohydrate ABC transporter permease n=1 Tax=unclassified Mesorhizobium TaxID=325217 RepID=UPI00086B42B2|nr:MULTISPECIES: sugar ABC transporter permease [unclassified Mesorhizobium]MBN9258088.1 sugar ABC transporter permease [Mesorhizobium sp.]ODT18780.1 MAG: sugar ABC transporter permease [Mesorhizobium sp. SCN 65-12]OJX71606.1 MAG: sugar ABC transporter permease [Mesorhizobium sp. 65-26]
MKNTTLAFLFVSPALLFLLAVLGWPLVQAVILSFQDVGVIGSEGHFIGLDNYAAVLGGGGFWYAFGRSIVWVLGNAIVQTALALATALILNQKFPGVKIARTWVILTWIVPTVVVVIIWRWLLSTSGGMINPLLVQAGIVERPVGFFSGRDSAMASLVLINSWRWFPFTALMMLAGLTRIPGDLYEAARIDGAGTWQRFKRITWPLLQPTLMVLGVVGTLLSFNVFDVIWLLTAGGPSGGTQTLPVLIYETAFKGYRLSEAATISVLTSILLMGFAFLTTRAMTATEASR